MQMVWIDIDIETRVQELGILVLMSILIQSVFETIKKKTIAGTRFREWFLFYSIFVCVLSFFFWKRKKKYLHEFDIG